MHLLYSKKPKINDTYFNIDERDFYKRGTSIGFMENSWVVREIYEQAKSKFSHIENASLIEDALVDLSDMCWEVCPKEAGSNKRGILNREILRKRKQYNKMENDLFTWPVYFGLIAICHLKEFESILDIIEEHHVEEGKEFSPESYLPQYIVEAKEALSIAWLLEHFTLEEKELFEGKSMRHVKASEERHSRAVKIKHEFYNLYIKENENKKIGKRTIAKQYYRSLPDEKKRIICPSLMEENAVRSLVDNGLNKYLKINTTT